MTRAVRVQEFGGPDALSWGEVEVGPPGAGEVRVRHTAIGLNYIDTYHRSGLNPLTLPTVIGMEAAGVVEAVGAGVDGLSEGDRVCYGTGPVGAYAEARVMPAARLVRTPAGIDDVQAMLRGMTVRYLLRATFRVQPGMTVLFHAAAGGVGLIACQWLKHLGATVIGTVGNHDKAELARSHGCDHVIVYSEQDFAPRVREKTGGEGVPVVRTAAQ